MDSLQHLRQGMLQFLEAAPLVSSPRLRQRKAGV